MSLEHAPQRDRRRPRRGRFEPLLIPVRDAFEMIGVGPTKGYEMVKAGLIETVKVGHSRMAVYASLKTLAQPQTQPAA